MGKKTFNSRKNMPYLKLIPFTLKRNEKILVMDEKKEVEESE